MVHVFPSLGYSTSYNGPQFHELLQTMGSHLLYVHVCVLIYTRVFRCTCACVHVKTRWGNNTCLHPSLLPSFILFWGMGLSLNLELAELAILIG